MAKFELPEFDSGKHQQRLTEISQQLQDPSIFQDRNLFASLNKEYTDISALINLWNELTKQIANHEEAWKLSDDMEMADLANTEIALLEKSIPPLLDKFLTLTLPKLDYDEANAIMEFRAGTGGVEASLFAEETMRMYLKYLEKAHFGVDVSSISYHEEGGIKEAVINVIGHGAFGHLRFEAGVHRVQRVPVTEASGRIHTSAISIAVIPEVTAAEVEMKESDLRIDVYRSSGPGGQSVNTTDSAVRITHLPTGITVSCQDGKSQHKNKERAMSILASKLKMIELEKKMAETNQLRSAAIQSGDRSAKVRTYNFPQSRLTDHRVNLTWFNIAEIMEGNLEEVITTVGSILRKEYAAR